MQEAQFAEITQPGENPFDFPPILVPRTVAPRPRPCNLDRVVDAVLPGPAKVGPSARWSWRESPAGYTDQPKERAKDTAFKGPP